MGVEPQTQAPGAAQWFVQAGGKVWGPYAEARIEAFVAEGRVAAETLMSLEAKGPFRPAARQARLHRLFGDAELPRSEVLPGSQGSAAQEKRAVQEAAAARPLLVWASVKSQKADRFEELLGAHGPFVRVGPGLWLVRSRVGPAALRNVMTRRLEASDALMVLDAPLDQAAWFNLDGDTDKTLRALWGAKAGR